MRSFSLLVLVAALAACSDDLVLEARIVSLPDDTTTLDMSGSRPNTARYYPMEFKSHVDHSVRLASRFEGGVPATFKTAVIPDTSILPRGTAKMKLQVTLPAAEGAFSGRVVVFSPDLPGWEKSYAIQGAIEDRPFEGGYLRPNPRRVDLGDCRPGETKRFEVTIESFGDQSVTIEDWNAMEEGVRLDPCDGSRPLPPRQTLTVGGELTVPDIDGRFLVRVRFQTDADNAQTGAVDVPVVGNVVPAYVLRPRARYGPREMYPAKPNEMPRVEVHATEGQEPFTIGSVTGHEEIFELVEKGGDEPAMVQALRFRVRPDAPTNPDENRSFTVRIQLLPFERVMEWTVDLRLLPAVHPVPALLDFGRVSLDHPKPLALRLAAVGARTVQVKQIEVVGQRFVVREPPRAPDMPWSCVVVVNPAVGRTGIITDQIILHTDDPDVPKVIVRARAIIE